MTEIVSFETAKSPATEIFPGIRARVLWEAPRAGKAMVVEFAPGSRWEGTDVHEAGPEEVYVVSGVFSDGVRDFPAGTFLHAAKGTSHVPQSKSGCTLFIFYPAV